MVGGLRDWRTARIGNTPRVEQKSKFAEEEISKSWGGPEELFGDLQSIPGVLTGFYAALMELVVISWRFWMGSS